MSHTTEPDYHDDGSDYEAHIFECDAKDCREFYSAPGTFQDVWEEAKRKGWRCVPKKIGVKVAEWKHLCPQHTKERL